MHSAEALIEADHALFEGIPVTAAPRTLLDFASVDPFFLDHALQSAYRLELLDLVAIDARSRAAVDSGVWHGSAPLWRPIARPRSSARVSSGASCGWLKITAYHDLR